MKMNYFVVGTNNLEAATKFYDSLFEKIEVNRVPSTEKMTYWLHKKAIELGGTCEGEPNQKGPRFSGYVRDLDRNKICFHD